MNPPLTNNHAGSPTSFINAANQSITVNGVRFAYRDIGPTIGLPLVLFNHWGAVLDNFDPAIIDGLAQTRRVITTDYRGIGGSGGTAPLAVGEMADDAIQLIRALGFETVDVLGFSLGGFVAQDIALKAPELVRRLILTGTGPAGGTGIDKVGSVSWPLMLKGLLTLRDPKFYLFFTSTTNGRRAASQYLQRLKARKKKSRQRPDAQRFPAAVEGHHCVGQAVTSKPRALADADADRQRR
ncbi:hypothetical protein EMIT0P294_130144 [Pseudomonas sp. IT-P294]